MIETAKLKSTGSTNQLLQMKTKDKHRGENHFDDEDIPEIMRKRSADSMEYPHFSSLQNFDLYIHHSDHRINYFGLSARKLLVYLMTDFTRRNFRNQRDTTLVSVDLQDYMEHRGWKSKKKAKETVQFDLNELFHISFRCYSRGRLLRCRLLQEVGIMEKNNITVRFTERFADELAEGGTINFPLKLLDTQTPHGFHIGLKILNYRHMNRTKKNRDIIRLQNLLSVCPELPTLEEVKKERGSVHHRIIKPFLKGLEEVSERLDMTFTFVTEEGTMLNSKEIADYIQFCKVRMLPRQPT